MPAIKVNWKEIFDGRLHILEEGVHFKRATSFCKYIYTKAKEYSVSIKPPEISEDGKCVVVQTRSNELEIYKPTKVIEAEIVESTDNIDKYYPRFVDNSKKHEKEYPFQQWFAVLLLGGQKEVELPKLNEFGNPIPIMQEFPGGFKAPTGKYVTEKKMVGFTPSLVLELRRPQDFTGSLDSMADLFSEVAKSIGVDPKSIHYEFRRKERKLVIRAGHIAEKYFEREDYPDKYDLCISLGIKNEYVMRREKVEKWVEQLRRDGQLVLYKHKDFLKEDNVSKIFHWYFPDLEWYAKKEKDNKMGWETFLITIRKPMLTRMQAGDGERGEKTIQRWMEMEEGKLIEQPFEQQKLEYEEKKLKNIGYARQKYLEQYRALQLEISNIKEHAPEEMKEQFLEVINSQLNGMKEEFADLLSVEEQKYLEEYKEPIETLLLDGAAESTPEGASGNILENDYEI